MKLTVTCENCRFWQGVDRAGEPIENSQATNGNCRKKPPTPFILPGGLSVPKGPQVVVHSMFAPTSENDWCGEGELAILSKN